LILSHERQFIFLKTRKTAGTSIEIALSDHCGPMDIKTPISLEDEAVRMDKGQAPSNYFVCGPYRPGETPPGYKEGTITKPQYDKFKQIPRQFHMFRNHATASEIIKFSGKTIWDRYFTFTVERNPWDFQVSRYFWRKKMIPTYDLDFETFLHKEGNVSNWDIYTLNDKVAVNAVVLFEDLAAGLSHLQGKLGFDISEGLPHAKGNTARQKRDYKDFYNDAQRKFVAQRFEKVIDTFKYTF